MKYYKTTKKLILVLSIASAALLAQPAKTFAATSPTLGPAGSYSVLGHTTVTNTGLTTMPGDLGISSGGAPTGFPPGTVGPPGTIRNTGDSLAAQTDNTAAFGYLDQGCDTTYSGTKDLVGENLVAGVYCAGAFELSGTLTLNGTGVWIFKSASTLTTSGTANVVGGDACNVWWRQVSSAVLGTNTSLTGNILSSTSISLANGVSLNGRALAQTGAVTLAANTFTGTSCITAPVFDDDSDDDSEDDSSDDTATGTTTVPKLPNAGIYAGATKVAPWSAVILAPALVLIPLLYILQKKRII